MSQIYPNLSEKFRREGICPICLNQMTQISRFACVNNHEICQRCRPYYYSCPTCLSPLTEINSSNQTCHYNPGYPMPPNPIPAPRHPTNLPYPPSAPSFEDFRAEERRSDHGYPSGMPVPCRDADLVTCPYSSKGCKVKFPEHLREMHSSRCHFRESFHHHHVDHSDHSDLIPCQFAPSGCGVRVPGNRIVSHEEHCSYRDMDRLRTNFGNVSLGHLHLVHCRYHSAGCKVKMTPEIRRQHEEKCHYRRADHCSSSSSSDCDSDQLEHCRYAHRGCRVRPNHAFKHTHEMNCHFRH